MDASGRVLTGLDDGRIVRVTIGGDQAGDRVEDIANTGGRPLGLHVCNDGTLLVCDSIRGLLRVDPDSGAVHELATHVDGRPLTFASNVVVGRSGRIYFTQSSQRFGFEDYLGDLFEHSGTGRLLVLDSAGTVRVLATGLHFANGLRLAADESWVDAAETGAYRVRRHHLDADAQVRVRSASVLIDNLPGLPDNVSDDDGLLWVALAAPRNPVLDVLLRLPGWVRKAAYALPAWTRKPRRATWAVAIDDDGLVRLDVRSGTRDYSMVTSAIRLGDHLIMGSIAESALAIVEVPPDRVCSNPQA